MPVPVVTRRKEDLYFAALPHLKAIPEVLEHIDVQHGRIPFAVVSGSTYKSGRNQSFPATIGRLRSLAKAVLRGLQ